MSRSAVLSLLAAIAALGLLLSGCTSAESPDSSAENGTRIVETVRGEVEIPTDPQRVVAVDWNIPPAMIDLGVTPVAIYEGFYEPGPAEARNVPDRYVEALADAQRIGDWDSLSVETVAEIGPDLIVTTGVGLDEETLDRLAEVAPLAQYSSDGGFLDSQLRLAEILDRTDEFEQLRDTYEDRARQIGDEHSEVLAETSWVSVSGGVEGTWFVEGGQTPAATLLSAVGATAIDEVDPDLWWDQPRSYETIGDLDDADVILYAADPDGEPAEQTAPLVEHGLFTALPAAQEGNVFGFTQGGADCVGWATDALDEIDGILEGVSIP